MKESQFSHHPQAKDWHQPELPFHEDPYKKSYEPHEMSSKEAFYSSVSKKNKPDPSTVEAILQEEEELWEN